MFSCKDNCDQMKAQNPEIVYESVIHFIRILATVHCLLFATKRFTAFCSKDTDQFSVGKKHE